jgi:hypothetical protein
LWHALAKGQIVIVRDARSKEITLHERHPVELIRQYTPGEQATYPCSYDNGLPKRLYVLRRSRFYLLERWRTAKKST